MCNMDMQIKAAVIPGLEGDLIPALKMVIEYFRIGLISH